MKKRKIKAGEAFVGMKSRGSQLTVKTRPISYMFSARWGGGRMRDSLTQREQWAYAPS